MEVRKLNPLTAENSFFIDYHVLTNTLVVLINYLKIYKYSSPRRRRLGIFSFFWELKMYDLKSCKSC
jgi:hypothetical protein